MGTLFKENHMETNETNTSLENSDNISETTTKDKPNKKKMSNKKFYAILVPSVLVLSALAVFSTILIYNALKPEPLALIGSRVNYTELITRVNNSSKTIEAEFADDSYNMMNYAVAKFASNPYTLLVGNGSSSSSSVLQTITAATITTPTATFNQNISITEKAPMGINASTALRVYDDRNGNIMVHANKQKEQWKTAEGEKQTYNEFIANYGKLNLPQYNIKVEGTEDFIFENTNASPSDGQYQINGVFDYNFNEESVASFKYTKNLDSSYTLDLQLDPTYACTFYTRKVKTNGNLDKRPTFNGFVELKVELDKNFNIISSHCKEEYTATLIILQDLIGEMNINFYYAKNAEEFKYNGETIVIPSITDDLAL